MKVHVILDSKTGSGNDTINFLQFPYLFITNLIINHMTNIHTHKYKRCAQIQRIDRIFLLILQIIIQHLTFILTYKKLLSIISNKIYAIIWIHVTNYLLLENVINVMFLEENVINQIKIICQWNYFRIYLQHLHWI